MFDKSRHCEPKAKQSIIAVTGPMAAGKNYICSQMEKEGWSTIDADLLVHDAIELVKDRILNTFIPYAEQQHLKLKREDGSIDRRALGELLFSFPELLGHLRNRPLLDQTPPRPPPRSPPLPPDFPPLPRPAPPPPGIPENRHRNRNYK